jgi:hypothetical protein
MNAFKSWIPGGTIHRYRWIYGDPRAPVREIVEEHRFLTRVPPLIADPRCVWPPCQWCVEIQGERDDRDVRWWTCELVGDGIVRLPPEVVVPGVRLPVGVPGVDGRLIAHVDPWGSGEGRTGMARGSGANLLVHFAGAESEETVPVLREALAKWSQGEIWVHGIVVVEPGTAEELQAPDGKTPLAWAEDFEGGWQKAFGVQELPAVYLIDPQGELVWQHAGKIEPDALRKALEEHLEEGEPLRYGRFRLGVEVGEDVPDFLFDYAPQRQVALRTFQGEPVTLVF